MDLNAGVLAALFGVLVLGFRHGIDWDHIAAISDITSTTATSEATPADPPVSAPMPTHGHDELAGVTPMHGHQHEHVGVMHVLRESRFAHEQRHAFGLATLYALGHASVVAALGIAALALNAILPEWVDPIMQRIVGVTLLVLGLWVLYSLIQYLRGKGEFRLRSRWMLVFEGARYAWGALQARIHGHEHRPSRHAMQYGPRTAFGVGMIHGIGAETGTQVLLIAGVAGAGALGFGLLAAFLIGLLMSNSLIAVLTATGFITAQRRKTLYVAVGTLAGVFSIVIGLFFLLDLADLLPDLQELLGFIGG